MDPANTDSCLICWGSIELVSTGLFGIANIVLALEEQYILREQATWKENRYQRTEPELFALPRALGQKRD